MPATAIQYDDDEVELPWYLAVTFPRQEGIAAAGLVGRRFRCYYPTESRSIRVNATRRRMRQYPLLPGYIFVAFDSNSDEWKRLTQVAGVRKVMTTSNEQPVVIPFADIKNIQQKEAELATNRRWRKPKIPFAIGQKVRLVEHPSFAGLHGTVVKTSRRLQSVGVQMDSNNFMVLVSVGQVEAI